MRASVHTDRRRTPCKTGRLLLLALTGVFPALALAADPPSFSPQRIDPWADWLTPLLEPALARLPDYTAQQEAIQASQARGSLVRALPDPGIGLSYQQDGWKPMALGTMPDSYLGLSFSQTFPWPGRRTLDGRAANAETDLLKPPLRRIKLDLEATLRQGALQLASLASQRALLADQALLWEETAATARVRYESGLGTQADLLQIALEQRRTDAQQIELDTAELLVRRELELITGIAPQSLPAPLLLEPLALPTELEAEPALEDALDHSPEWELARWTVQAAEARQEATAKQRRPDLTATATLMYRGALEPMWMVGIGGPLTRKGPQQLKDSAATSELASAKAAQQAVERQLILALDSRRIAMAGIRVALARSEQELIPLSRTAWQAALAAYASGKGSLQGVYPALQSVLQERSRVIALKEAAWGLDIEHRRVSMTVVRGAFPAAGSGMGGGMEATAEDPGQRRSSSPGPQRAAGGERSSGGGMGM